ncbi:uncharacterized protein [Anabrus simplex]|uniref:uncharacterized protein n=1 Tax=Anabrus simplex TaxID=316456 RepID=UPI0035A2682D
MDRQRRTYKTRGFNYCDDIVRTQRARVRNEERRMLRRGSFVRNRSLEVSEEETKVSKKELLKQRYEKWKKEKELSKQLSKRANRPPFKCGSVRHNDAELYKNVDISNKVTRSNTKEQKPLAPAGFVFKAPKGIVPLPCKPLTTPRPLRNCKIFPSPQILRKKNQDKENSADQHGTESFMCRDFATMSLLPVQHPKGLKNEMTKSQAGGDELPERRRTRALTRFEGEEKRDAARH